MPLKLFKTLVGKGLVHGVDLAFQTHHKSFENPRDVGVVDVLGHDASSSQAGRSSAGEGDSDGSSICRPANVATARINCARSIGLARCSLQPASRHVWLSPAMALAVSARIGRS